MSFSFIYGIITESRCILAVAPKGSVCVKCNNRTETAKLSKLRSSRIDRSRSDLSLLGVTEDLLGSTLDDTTGHRKAGALLEEKINLASSHAALIDTPEKDC